MPLIKKEVLFYKNTLTNLLNELQEKQRGIISGDTSVDHNNNIVYMVTDDGNNTYCYVPVSKQYVNGVWEYKDEIFGNLRSEGSLTTVEGLLDNNMAVPLPIAESGNLVLDPKFSNSSIIGALNELINTGGGGIQTLIQNGTASVECAPSSDVSILPTSGSKIKVTDDVLISPVTDDGTKGLTITTGENYITGSSMWLQPGSVGLTTSTFGDGFLTSAVGGTSMKYDSVDRVKADDSGTTISDPNGTPKFSCSVAHTNINGPTSGLFLDSKGVLCTNSLAQYEDDPSHATVVNKLILEDRISSIPVAIPSMIQNGTASVECAPSSDVSILPPSGSRIRVTDDVVISPVTSDGTKSVTIAIGENPDTGSSMRLKSDEVGITTSGVTSGFISSDGKGTNMRHNHVDRVGVDDFGTTISDTAGVDKFFCSTTDTNINGPTSGLHLDSTGVNCSNSLAQYDNSEWAVVNKKILEDRISSIPDVIPPLSQVLTTGNDAGGQDIVNAGYLFVGDNNVGLAENVWKGTAVFGENGSSKVIIGYLAQDNSNYKGAVVGAHTSELNGWDQLSFGATDYRWFNSVNNQVMALGSNGVATLPQATIPEIIVAGPKAVPTAEYCDYRYYNVSGDTLAGTMNAGDQNIVNVGKIGIGTTTPAPNTDIDIESSTPLIRMQGLSTSSGGDYSCGIGFINSASTTNTNYHWFTGEAQSNIDYQIRYGNSSNINALSTAFEIDWITGTTLLPSSTIAKVTSAGDKAVPTVEFCDDKYVIIGTEVSVTTATPVTLGVDVTSVTIQASGGTPFSITLPSATDHHTGEISLMEVNTSGFPTNILGAIWGGSTTIGGGLRESVVLRRAGSQWTIISKHAGF